MKVRHLAAWSYLGVLSVTLGVLGIIGVCTDSGLRMVVGMVVGIVAFGVSLG